MKIVYGVGINDIGGSRKEDSYVMWYNMLQRCYKYPLNHPSYQDCEVGADFLVYSNFKKFYDKNFRNGYELDKDILIQGNKVYSAETCSFVPPYLNKMLQRIDAKGYTYDSKTGKYMVMMSLRNKRKFLGYFEEEGEARNTYVKARELYIQKIACKSYKKGEISPAVLKALMNIKIER